MYRNDTVPLGGVYHFTSPFRVGVLFCVTPRLGGVYRFATLVRVVMSPSVVGCFHAFGWVPIVCASPLVGVLGFRASPRWWGAGLETSPIVGCGAIPPVRVCQNFFFTS